MKYQYKSLEWEILDTMRDYGGSFIKKLAELYHLADRENQRLLESAFRDYFIKYDEMTVERRTKI